jgi:hypothetical protein
MELLAAAMPDRADAFRRTLAVLTEDILAHPDVVAAWTSSRLNGNGAPLEHNFSSLDQDLRYTVEIGGPNTPPPARLNRAGVLLRRLGAAVPDLQPVQDGGPLRWGAWIGVRHRSAGTGFKLYAEVPEGSACASALLYRHLPGGLGEPEGRVPRLVAVGEASGGQDGRREFYFHLPGLGLSQDALAYLLGRAGLADRVGALAGLIRDAPLAPPDGAAVLPDIEVGLSLSTLPGGARPVFSAFAFARNLVGGDGLIRLQALRMAKARSWSLGPYAALTAPIARNALVCSDHNVLAFIAGPAPMLGLHVSLSPPIPQCEAVR